MLVHAGCWFAYVAYVVNYNVITIAGFTEKGHAANQKRLVHLSHNLPTDPFSHYLKIFSSNSCTLHVDHVFFSLNAPYSSFIKNSETLKLKSETKKL